MIHLAQPHSSEPEHRLRAASSFQAPPQNRGGFLPSCSLTPLRSQGLQIQIFPFPLCSAKCCTPEPRALGCSAPGNPSQPRDRRKHARPHSRPLQQAGGAHIKRETNRRLLEAKGKAGCKMLHRRHGEKHRDGDTALERW